MRRVVWVAVQLLICLALVLGASALWTGWDRVAAVVGLPVAGAASASSAPASVDTRVAVAVVPVSEGSDDVVIEAVGTGMARRSVELRPEDAGRVVSVEVEAGDRVAGGTVILRLEDRDQHLALELAEAELAEAERVVVRYQTLESRSITSTAVLTEATTTLEVARIEREAAAAALEDRVLRAPFDGIVGFPEVSEGDRVDQDAEVATFDDRGEILVEFALPEIWLDRLAVGAEAIARTPAHQRETFAARIAAIDSRVDPVSRSARVRAAIDNSADRLRPGASFTIELRLGGPVYPRVPDLSLLYGPDGAYVWAVEADGPTEVVRQVPVRLVRRLPGAVLVEGALEPGTRVVIEGVQRLRPGREVRVIGTPAAAVAAPPSGASDRG